MGKHWTWWGGLLAVVACLAFLSLGSSVLAQKTKGKTRAAETKYIMKGINFAHCSALAKELKEGPKDDKEWAQVVLHASLLNEAGYLLMDDGRCPDKDWAGATKMLKEGSAKVLDAAKAKDVEAARTAFKQVTGACAACHKVHKTASK
jgi:cytochrome c556